MASIKGSQFKPTIVRNALLAISKVQQGYNFFFHSRFVEYVIEITYLEIFYFSYPFHSRLLPCSLRFLLCWYFTRWQCKLWFSMPLRYDYDITWKSSFSFHMHLLAINNFSEYINKLETHSLTSLIISYSEKAFLSRELSCLYVRVNFYKMVN